VTEPSPPSSPVTSCSGVTYALLWEPFAAHTSQNISVCGGVRRQMSVHVTTTHRLDIALMHTHPGQSPPYFLLQYQGKTWRIFTETVRKVCKQIIMSDFLLIWDIFVTQITICQSVNEAGRSEEYVFCNNNVTNMWDICLCLTDICCQKKFGAALSHMTCIQI